MRRTYRKIFINKPATYQPIRIGGIAPGGLR